MSKVENLHNGDPRLRQLADAIDDVIDERGEGIPILAIAGVLDWTKLKLFIELMEE